jgi:hypothetical protein
MTYVEYGPRMTFPAPFESAEGSFVGVVLKGDEDKIKALVKKMLNEPAQGAIEYEPLGPCVLMMAGQFKRQYSLVPTFVNAGYASETGLVFWVPVRATQGDEQHLRLVAPYVFVDNPMSLLCGREDFGYAKTMALFAPQGGLGQKVEVSPFGGNFGSGSQAGYHRVIELVAVGALPMTGGLVSGADIANPETPEAVASELFLRATGEMEPDTGVPLPNLALLLELVKDLVGKQAREVFLKQFRDVQPANAACYQAIIEAPLQFTNVQPSVSPHEWTVNITPLASYPLGDELGIDSETTSLAFELKTNMILGEGVVVAPQGAVADWQPKAAAWGGKAGASGDAAASRSAASQPAAAGGRRRRRGEKQ